MTGPADEAVGGEVVSQSETEVVVAAKVRRSTGSQPGNGVFREVEVTLDAPIGDREVRNRDGSVVPEQPAGAGS